MIEKRKFPAYRLWIAALALLLLVGLIPCIRMAATAEDGAPEIPEVSDGQAYYYNPLAEVMEVADGVQAVTSSSSTWTDGWYVVEGDVSTTTRYTVSGKVNLILMDNASLTTTAGITVSGADNSLTIWAQTAQTGDTTGKLTATVNTGRPYAAIGGTPDSNNGENITINGGVISVSATSDAAAIGGGYNGSGENIRITGGEVNATASRGAGIGSGSGNGAGSSSGNASNIEITGGKVTATSQEGGAGIGTGAASNNEITATGIHISGGEVVAKGGYFYHTNYNAGDGGGRGIGGGANMNNSAGSTANSSNIVISGGIVTAIGGSTRVGGFDPCTTVSSEYVHLTYGYDDASLPSASWMYEPEEWTGNSTGLSRYPCETILPMTIRSVVVVPEEYRLRETNTLDYYGAPQTVNFTGIFYVTVQGEELELEGVADGEWEFTGLAGSESRTESNHVWLGTDETATELQVKLTLRGETLGMTLKINHVPVTYVDTTDGGVEKTVQAPVALLDEGFNSSYWPSLDGGWYFLPPGSQLSISGRDGDASLSIYGNVNLVLADNASVYIPWGIELDANATLTIWGQKEQYGYLYAGSEQGEDTPRYPGGGGSGGLCPGRRRHRRAVPERR